MKRQISIIACLVLVVAMVCALASCDLINKITGQQPEHEHSYTEGKCECGAEDPNYVPPHTHNFVDGKCECGAEDPDYVPECTEHANSVEVTKEATCTEAGEKTLTCTICGHVETVEIAPNGHTEEKIPGKAPTCTEPGLSDGKHCTVCGEVLSEQIEINASGHSFVEGTCSACGEADPDYNGPKTYVFHFSDVVAGADKDAIAEGTTFANGYFTIVGGVTQRVKDDAVYCVEVAKNGGGAIQFTVTGTATVEVQFSSTGGSNTSKIGIFDADGNLVANNEGIITVTGASAGMTVVTYNLPAGTYSVVSPASDVDAGETDYNRGARVFYVNVTETPAEEEPKNEIKVETTDTYTMYNLDFFTFTATAEGYYTFKIPAGLGILRDGANAPEIDYYDNADGAEFTIGLEAEQEVIFWVSATTKDMWTIEWSFEAGEVENKPDDPIEGDATELVVGSNNLVFADGELSQGKTYPFTVTEEGTYTFRSDLMAVVMDADGNTLGRGQASLTPGTYSVTFFSMMPLPSNSFTVNITFEAPATGEPDGSEQYPFVWETLPESVTFVSDNNNLIYYVFTATADGSVTFTWAVEGNDWFNYFELVDGMTTANSGSGFAQTSHTFVIETGKTYRVGLGTWNEGGETVVTIAFVACAHEWSEATCQTLSTCAKCGATTGDYADHIPNSENPTCGDPAECTVCGAEVGYIPHEWNEGEIIQQPDCSTETNGIKKLTCTVCGATQEEEIWAFHDWVVDEEIPVTCTEDGYYKAHCSVCNKIDEYTTEAQGHYNYFEGTCGDTVACLECGESFVKEHFFWYEATCTQAAYCGNCEQYVGEPAGHQYTYPCDKICSVCYEETNPNATHTIVHVEAKAATCYEDGNIEHWYCSDCGIAWADEALTQQTNLKSVILPMAHAPATHVAAKAPTCTENGNIEYWLCEACGQAWLDEACTQNTNVLAVVLPTIDHDYVYGICSVCQAKDPAYVDYYLVGYINGADYGCEADYANLGEYKFVDGKLTVTFKADSYVFVKTGNLNGESVKWYLFETYHDASKTEGTLIENKSEKMFIPGNVEVVFTLVVNEDGTLTLSYHLHSYEAVVTEPTCTNAGYTTHTCSCGASYTDSEVEALGHADNDGNYKCDACSTKMLPADGTALTIPQAIAVAKVAGSSYSTQKYYITGIVTNLYNTQYGNLYLKDADGNEICIYGLYTADGKTRYDKMSYKPVEGDELTVYTILGTYNGNAQGKNAWMDDVVAHEHNYTSVVTEPTCLKDGYTTHTCSICKNEYVDSTVEALGHTTEEGTCERCGLEVGGAVSTEPVTVSKTMKELITQYSWTSNTTKQSFDLDNVVSVKINGGNNTGKAYNGDHIRIYATDSPAGTITISVAEGYELASIKITTQTGTYAFLYVDGTTTDICNKTVEVSGSSVLLKSVKNGSDGKQVRVTGIEVTYKAVG